MKRVLKFSVAAVALLLTVILAVAIYMVNLDPETYKRWIVDRFYEETGRVLTIGDDFDISFYPWLGVSMNDVRVSNPGFGDDPLLAADAARFRIKLLPLIQRQYVIDTVRLHGLTVNLVVAENGTTNWEDLLPAEEPEDSPPAAERDQGLPLANVVLGGVDIREAAFSLDDRARDERYTINGLDLQTGELSYGDPIELDLVFAATATQPQLEADVRLSGTVTYNADGSRYDISPLRMTSTLRGPDVPEGSAEVTLASAIALDLNADTLQITGLDLDAPGLQLLAVVDGRRVQTASPMYNAELELRGSDLTLPFRILGEEELVRRIEELDSQTFDLSTRVALDMASGNLELTALEGNILGATLDGNLQAQDLDTDAARFEGYINASGPDLPTLVEIAGRLQGGDSPLREYGRQLAAVPDTSFAAESRFAADMGSGEATVEPLTLELLGTSIDGTLRGSGIGSDAARLSGQLQGLGPDLPLLMQIAGHLLDGPEGVLNRQGQQLAGLDDKGFSADARFDVDLQHWDIQVPVLSARALGFTLEGNLTTGNDGSVDGALRLDGNRLPEILAALEQPDLAAVTDSLRLDVGITGDRANLAINPLRLVMVLDGPTIPDAPVDLTLTADSRIDLENETLTLKTFSLTGLDLQASGELEASSIMQAPAFSGRLSLEPFNLRRLAGRLNQQLPDTAADDAFERIGFNGAFSGAADHLDVEQLTLMLDDSTLQGNLAVEDFAKPALSFRLNIDQLDADRYLPPEQEEAAADDTPAKGTEIPTDGLRELELDGELQIGRFIAAGMTFSEFAVTLSAAEGQLSVEPATQLYSGSFMGELGLDVSGDIPAADLEATLTGVEVAPLMRDMLGTSYLSGQGNIELSLDMVGGDSIAMQRSLDGTGRVELVDGVLQGVDVGAVLAQVETMIRTRRLQEVQRGEQTNFDTFSATLLVDDGIVSTSNLRLGAPGFRISGEGVLVNLNDESLAFELVASVDRATATQDSEEYDLGGYDLPIACTGTIDNIRCLPAVERILREALSGAVQREMGDLLERALGGDRNQDSGSQQQEPGQGEDGDQPDQEEEADPAEELLNRALENLFR